MAKKPQAVKEAAKPPAEPPIDDLMDSAARCVLNSIIADDPVEYEEGKKVGGMSAAERAQAFRACVAYWAAKKRLGKKDVIGDFNGSIEQIAGLGHGRGSGATAAADADDLDPFAE